MSTAIAQDAAAEAGVATVADAPDRALRDLAGRFGLRVERVACGVSIPGSYWGEPEAGVIGGTLYVRGDTPVHSLLHEMSHVVCMDSARRARLHRDAGGDDDEESAVCYLQVLLADALPWLGRERLMHDMDAWGYSFRLGSTARWFAEDADDARTWLQRHGLLDSAGRCTWRLRAA